MANNNFMGNMAEVQGGAIAYTHECFNFSSLPGSISTASAHSV